MPMKTIRVTPPILYHHHDGKGPARARAFLKAARIKAKNVGCRVRAEVADPSGTVWVDMECGTKAELRQFEKGVRASAEAAARLKGIKR
jgi:hypothetical protein